MELKKKVVLSSGPLAPNNPRYRSALLGIDDQDRGILAFVDEKGKPGLTIRPDGNSLWSQLQAAYRWREPHETDVDMLGVVSPLMTGLEPAQEPDVRLDTERVPEVVDGTGSDGPDGQSPEATGAGPVEEDPGGRLPSEPDDSPQGRSPEEGKPDEQAAVGDDGSVDPDRPGSGNALPGGDAPPPVEEVSDVASTPPASAAVTADAPRDEPKSENRDDQTVTWPPKE